MAETSVEGRIGERSDGGEVDLRALGRGIWRRRMAIILPTLLAAAAAVAFVQLSSPYYRSNALILIENREIAAPRSATDRESLPDEQAVASQVQLMQSRDLARQVVKSLDLAANPEFAADRPGLVGGLMRALGLGGAESAQPFNEKVVDNVVQDLTVYPVTGSRVVGVEFTAKNPDVAARVVNGFADAYLDIQRDAKRATNRQTSQYLADEIETLRAKVGEAEERVEQFRAKAGLLVGTNNTTVAAQQLGDTTVQLSASRSQQNDAQAKADNIRATLRQGRPAEALDIANSELIRSLAQERSRLAAQIASEGRTLLPQHPRMRELSAQLNGLDGQIRSEAEKLARAFENDAKTAGARVAALTKQLESMKGDAASANNQDVQLRAMERDARSQRELLEQMLNRYRETSARENPEGLLADARVISRGAAAAEPYFPKKGPTVLLATIGAFVLALFAAAAAELFSTPVRRPESGDATPPPAVGETTTAFGRLRGPISKPAAEKPAAKPAPTTARQPDLTAMSAPRPAREPAHESPAVAQTPAAEPAPVVSETAKPQAARPQPVKPQPVKSQPSKPQPVAPQPAMAEAAAIEVADASLVAALARQLASAPADNGALRILSAGARPGLDVFGVASRIASTVSEQGRRVVLIDASGGSESDGSPGLSDLLLGDATFAQAIHRTDGSRVHLVPQGSDAFTRLDAHATARLNIVLDALALTYDFVMVAAPGGLGGADAFAPFCGAAVLLSDKSAADATTVEAHERLKRTGIDDVVVLLVPNDDDRPRGRWLAA
ncbi:hypothetical protein K6K41_25025 [Chenggangzhangella methanolivorans]|uniref:Polysaccharide chain length determinant N-terminal domain-containing protein n=2 Tax=Chenggangzhangella methanolivorans TaxID=1437009 RepID=A0A9E6RFB1_9HYPH|nr:hypothetical protein K6K41_25025 [Chenggangzhangella methanolivorans]